jgi:hypothetical protein
VRQKSSRTTITHSTDTTSSDNYDDGNNNNNMMPLLLENRIVYHNNIRYRLSLPKKQQLTARSPFPSSHNPNSDGEDDNEQQTFYMEEYQLNLRMATFAEYFEKKYGTLLLESSVSFLFPGSHFLPPLGCSRQWHMLTLILVRHDGSATRRTAVGRS